MLLPRGLGATPEELQDQFTAYQQHVHAVALAIAAALARGDTATVATLRADLRATLAKMQGDVAAINQKEMPAPLLQTLAAISDDVSAGLGKAVSLLPSISTGLVAVAAIAAVFFFWGMRPRGRRA